MTVEEEEDRTMTEKLAKLSILYGMFHIAEYAYETARFNKSDLAEHFGRCSTALGQMIIDLEDGMELTDEEMQLKADLILQIEAEYANRYKSLTRKGNVK